MAHSRNGNISGFHSNILSEHINGGQQSIWINLVSTFPTATIPSSHAAWNRNVTRLSNGWSSSLLSSKRPHDPHNYICSFQTLWSPINLHNCQVSSFHSKAVLANCPSLSTMTCFLTPLRVVRLQLVHVMMFILTNILWDSVILCIAFLH